MADDKFENAAFQEFTFNGVVHRVPVTPESTRRWHEGEEAIGMGPRGEPFVGEDGKLIEHHGLPHDPDEERVEPEVVGEPFDPGELDEPDDDEGEDPYPDEP